MVHEHSPAGQPRPRRPFHRSRLNLRQVWTVRVHVTAVEVEPVPAPQRRPPLLPRREQLHVRHRHLIPGLEVPRRTQRDAPALEGLRRGRRVRVVHHRRRGVHGYADGVQFFVAHGVRVARYLAE